MTPTSASAITRAMSATRAARTSTSHGNKSFQRIDVSTLGELDIAGQPQKF